MLNKLLCLPYKDNVIMTFKEQFLFKTKSINRCVNLSDSGLLAVAPSQTVEYASGPSVFAEVVADPVAAGPVRPVRSPSPFFGIITTYEKPHKTQHHHHHHYHHEEPEPEHHHHHYHQEEHEPHYHKPQHHKPQHQNGGGAGSFASAGSFAGGSGSGSGHSQSIANSQSASFGFGPFQASYSASAAQSGSQFG